MKTHEHIHTTPRKFMDHGWVTVNYNVARCSLIIVPVKSSRVGVTTRRRLIKYTYPREGSALVRKKNDFTRLPEVCKSRSTGAQKLDPCSVNNWVTWSAVRLPQIRTPQWACWEHKAFYWSSQVEPSVSALWVKGSTRKQPGTVKLQVGRPITVHFSMRTATNRDFPWSILITALWAAAHRVHRIRLGEIEKTSNSKLSSSTFRSNFFKRFSSTDSFVILVSHGTKSRKQPKTQFKGDPALI